MATKVTRETGRKGDGETEGNPPPAAVPAPARWARILVQQLDIYRQGEITNDPLVVAWLDRPGGAKLVEEVK
jgi:hypothetical protein